MGIIDGKTGTHRTGNAVTVHNGLSAVMSCADCHAELVEQRAHIIGMRITNQERKNRSLVRSLTKDTDIGQLAKLAGGIFEQVCLMHLPQMKKALGISGVNTKASSWFLPGDSENDGAQIDLLIERQDQIVNICEMKFSRTNFTVTKEYEKELLRKEELFIQNAKPRQAVHLTLVTTIGLKENLHSSVFQSEICLDDLFAEA